MIIESKVAEIASTMPVKKAVRMSIAKGQESHIVARLTNIYADNNVAVAREYLSNAYDSHVASGKTDVPFLVTLPTAFSSNFIVQDFGSGLSSKNLEEIYSQYGYSTKRTTNDEIGGLGLGCKAALALTTGFTMTAVKDGLKNRLFIEKDEEGVGTLNFLILDEETTEPDGVTVTIPIPDAGAFLAAWKNNRITLGYPKGSLLVNGAEPEDSIANGNFREVSDSILMDVNNGSETPTYSYNSKLWFVVGPVSYSIPVRDLPRSVTSFLYDDDDDFSLQIYLNRMVVKLNIGDVAFPSSRDSFVMTDEKTQLSILTALQTAKGEAVLRTLLKVIGEYPERKEAYETFNAVKSTMSRYRRSGSVTATLLNDFLWNGETIPGRRIKDASTYPLAVDVHKGTPTTFDFQEGHEAQGTVYVTEADVTEVKEIAYSVLYDYRKLTEAKAGSNISLMLFTDKSADELSVWVEAQGSTVTTFGKLKEEVAAMRAERNAERKAARAAAAANGTSSRVTVAPALKVSPLYVNRYSSYVTKRTSVDIVEVASDSKVVYLQKSANDTAEGYWTNQMVDAARSHYSYNKQLAESLRFIQKYAGDVKYEFVIIPTKRRLSALTNVFPDAVSLAEAFKTAVNTAIADEAVKLEQTYMKQHYDWMTNFSHSDREKLENEDTRAWFSSVLDVNTTAVAEALLTLIGQQWVSLFLDGRNLHDEFIQKAGESRSQRYPMMEFMDTEDKKARNVAIQYINMMDNMTP